jgi:hypothetical protein
MGPSFQAPVPLSKPGESPPTPSGVETFACSRRIAALTVRARIRMSAPSSLASQAARILDTASSRLTTLLPLTWPHDLGETSEKKRQRTEAIMQAKTSQCLRAHTHICTLTHTHLVLNQDPRKACLGIAPDRPLDIHGVAVASVPVSDHGDVLGGLVDAAALVYHLCVADQAGVGRP